MKITNSDQFSKALNFFCSDGFNALEKIDQKCFEKTLVASIESIKDSRLIIKNALKYQLGIDINNCRTWSEHPNCKKIGFVAFLFDEDKETILKMYFKMNCFGYISNDDMNICEFKSSTYKGEHIEEVECKRSSKGEVKHPYENIHNN